MLLNPVGLRPEKGCAGGAQQKLKTTDPTSRQRGRPHNSEPVSLEKEIEKEGERLVVGQK
jgi:hypothetical protein